MVGLVDILRDYEAGYLDICEQMELFARLIRTGQAWILPLHYRRTGAALIEQKLITRNGQITDKGRALILKLIVDEGEKAPRAMLNPR